MIDPDELDKVKLYQRCNMVVKMQLLKARDSKEAIAALQHLEFDCVSIDEDLSDNEKLLITELIIENIYKQGIYVPTVVFTTEKHAQNELTLVKAENLAQTLQQAIYIHKALKSIAAVNRFGESEEYSSFIWNCKLTPAEVNNLYKLLEINGILGYLAISWSKQRSLKPEKSPKPSGFDFAADSTSFNLTPFAFKSAIAPPRAINLLSYLVSNRNFRSNFALTCWQLCSSRSY